MRRADAVLHALIMISSSIRPSLMSPGAVDCRMKTGWTQVVVSCGGGCGVGWGDAWSRGCGRRVREEEARTVFVPHRLADRHGRLLVRVLQDHDFRQLDA